MNKIIHLGQIRRIWFTERNLFRDHLLRLDEENLRLRFGRMVSDQFIDDYVAGITDLTSLIYGLFEDGKIIAAAELRKCGDIWLDDAEAAFSVEKRFQNRGVGTELFSRVVRAANNRNIKRIHVNCLAENAKMRHIANKFDTKLTFSEGDIIGKLRPDGPTYISLFEEALDDSSGIMMAAFDLQKSYMKAA